MNRSAAISPSFRSAWRPAAVCAAALLLGLSLSAADSPEPAAPADSGALDAKLKKEPGGYLLQLQTAKAHADAGRIANAEACFVKARRLVPESLETYYPQCVMYLKAGRYADAEQIARQWLARDGKSYYGILCLADALSLKGEVKESLSKLRDLQRMYPSDSTILEAMKLRQAYLRDDKGLAETEKKLAELKAHEEAQKAAQ